MGFHQQTDLQVILSFLFSFLGIGRWRLVKAHMWLDIAASSLPLGQRRYEVAKTRDDMILRHALALVVHDGKGVLGVSVTCLS